MGKRMVDNNSSFNQNLCVDLSMQNGQPTENPEISHKKSGSLITLNFSRDEIKLDNSIVERAIGKLGRMPFLLFLFLCADFSREKLEETPEVYRLTFRNSDFLKSIQYTSDSGYREIKKYIEQLAAVRFSIPHWDKGELAGETITGLILDATIFKRGYTTVRIGKELAPYYYTTKVERDRTIARFNIIKGFKNIYSAKIYFLLARWRNIRGKKVLKTVDEIKEYLGIENVASYKEYKKLNQLVLAAAQKEINERSDMTFEYKGISKGPSTGRGRRQITHIEFSFSEKETKEKTELLTGEQISYLYELAENMVEGTGKTALEFYNYAFDKTAENCKNKKGFFKYMEKILLTGGAFLGKDSLRDDRFEESALEKTRKLQNNIIEKKRNERKQEALKRRRKSEEAAEEALRRQDEEERKRTLHKVKEKEDQNTSAENKNNPQTVITYNFLKSL